MPSTFSTIRFVRHHRATLVFLSPETRDVAVRDSGDKWVQSTELDIVYIGQSICVGSFAGVI